MGRERTKPSSPGPDSSTGEDKTALKKLEGLVKNLKLFHTPGKKAYAVVPVDNHVETHEVRSRSFDLWLSERYWRQENTPPPAEDLRIILKSLEGRALFGGDTEDVFVRMAGRDGCVHIDLGDEEWRGVEIRATGWKTVAKHAVRFVRQKGMRPLPVPVRGGRLDELRPLLNLRDDDNWVLFVGALIAALSPWGPFFILEVLGVQGSAKTTLSRIFRRLVDPSVALVRSEPSEVRDLMIAARNCWCVVFDNLSRLADWLSDALCRLATGGGFSTRELYTDTDETILDVKRPVVLNGIEAIVKRGDLLSRTVSLSLAALERRTV